MKIKYVMHYYSTLIYSLSKCINNVVNNIEVIYNTYIIMIIAIDVHLMVIITTKVIRIKLKKLYYILLFYFILFIIIWLTI
jgi:hypothetical protein